MVNQDDEIIRLRDKIGSIKFLPSTSTDDEHFTKNKNLPNLETIPLPNVLPTFNNTQETQKQPTAISPTANLNQAFNNLNVNKPTASKNVLLNSLLNSNPQPPSQPLIPAVQNLFNQTSLQSIEILKKIDKLRDELRYFKKTKKYTFDNKDDSLFVDITDLMFQFCRSLNIFIEYKVQQTVDCMYAGALYLDKYKISSNVNKKKKKCKLFTYKDAFELLISNSTLAVRSIQNIDLKTIDYELYNIDGTVTYRQQSSTDIMLQKDKSNDECKISDPENKVNKQQT